MPANKANTGLSSSVRHGNGENPNLAPPSLPLDRTIDQSGADLERAQLLSRHLGPPAQVEGYDIQRCLGAGAFGTVWLAVQRSTGKQVAIKFYQHRGGLDWPLLHREVEKLAFLYTDRDIVQLIDVGWDSSPPYYVMEFLERGSLEQLLQQGPLPASEAIRIVHEVAQALVHAHGRGILHCDLKPANVLLDNDWKVRLADFGQSRLSSEQLPALGTLFYMAPEQADLKATPDASWDVYALGALLYHLLTGGPPYRTPELETMLQAAPSLVVRLEQYRLALLQSPRPTRHRRVRGVDRALGDIVDRCLEPNHGRRFANAQAVLDAIDRRIRQRARRPLIALGLVAPVLLLGVTVSLGVAGWQAAVAKSESSLIRAVQAGNVYAAKGVASTVLLRLHQLSQAVELTANGAELRGLFAGHDPNGMQAYIEQLQDSYGDPQNRLAQNGDAPPFDSWVIMDRTGVILARSPKSAVIGGNYGYRDYFQGPMRQAEEDNDQAYVSSVFRSKSDTRYKFAISAVVRAGPGQDSAVLGVVVATITTGSLPLRDEQRTAVLVGRLDPNRGQNEPPESNSQSQNFVLMHPALASGDLAEKIQNDALRKVELSRRRPAEVSAELLMDDNYHDPLAARSSNFSGRWLAGFAPVGNTNFAVIVQQRYAEATDPVKSLASSLAWRGWGALSLGVILLGVIWYFVQRAMSAGDRVPAPSPAIGPIANLTNTDVT